MKTLIKRIATSLFLSIFLTLPTYAFSDTENHTNRDAIDYLQQKNIVEGYSDGSYQPDTAINRAEFLKISLEVLTQLHPEITISDAVNCFPDVHDEWFAKYVCFAKINQIIDGYPDGYFRPEQNINLAEALKITLNIYSSAVFTIEGEEWYEGYIRFMNNYSLFVKIDPTVNHLVTRGEMAQVIKNLDEHYDNVGYPTTPDAVEETPENDWPETTYTPGERGPIVDTTTIVDDLKVGDEIHLANNMTVKIADINTSNSIFGIIDITVEHFLNNEALSTESRTHVLGVPSYDGWRSTWNEEYGYRLTLIDYNEINDTVKVEFKPLTPYLNTPEDLYSACYQLTEDPGRCYVYSLFEPITGEIEINTENFQIFGPSISEEYLQGMGEQFELCYQADSDFMGIEKDFEKIPVHFLANENSGIVVTSNTGIKWPMYRLETENAYANKTTCINNTIAHELVHAIILDTAISDVLNEGLATFVSNQIIDDGSNFSCSENGYYRYGTFHELGKMNKYSQIPFTQEAWDLYQTSACFWNEYYNDFGQENFLDTMKIFAENRHLRQHTYVIEMLEEKLGIDLSDYLEKYGFNYTDEDAPSERIAETYAPFGGANATRWDGNYDN